MLTLLVLLGAVQRTMNKQVVDTTMVHTANEKQDINTTMVRTSANEKRDVNTRMVHTSDEKQVTVGTKSGTDQDYHGRILKIHSRSEYNSTSEKIVDGNREGFTSVTAKRNEKSTGYVSPTIQILP